MAGLAVEKKMVRFSSCLSLTDVPPPPRFAIVTRLVWEGVETLVGVGVALPLHHFLYRKKGRGQREGSGPPPLGGDPGPPPHPSPSHTSLIVTLTVPPFVVARAPTEAAMREDWSQLPGHPHRTPTPSSGRGSTNPHPPRKIVLHGEVIGGECEVVRRRFPKEGTIFVLVMRLDVRFSPKFTSE